MAIIKGGSIAGEAYVDDTPKALRVILYDAAGNPYSASGGGGGGGGDGSSAGGDGVSYAAVVPEDVGASSITVSYTAPITRPSFLEIYHPNTTAVDVYIKRIWACGSAIYNAGLYPITIHRLTAAGSGGALCTPQPRDISSGAATTIFRVMKNGTAPVRGTKSDTPIWRSGATQNPTYPGDRILYEHKSGSNMQAIRLKASVFDGIALCIDATLSSLTQYTAPALVVEFIEV